MSTPNEQLQPCVVCGTPSENRWCSNACRIAEDGPQPGYDYEPELDEDDEGGE